MQERSFYWGFGNIGIA